MPLEEYRRKRDFGVTPEPAGETARGGPALSYVIQKHAASRLHWDFRIELDGVLLSWAVPKGPSFDPAEKRLAMHVEDHPVAYGGFEGTIPAGEYGGGTVMLWDRGTWEPFGKDARDAAADLKAGHLKMVLHGERLKGRWVLVRTRGYGGHGESWLLIKEHDGNERPHGEFDAIAEWMTSVATGRTMEQIAEAGDAVWHSNDPTGGPDTGLTVKPPDPSAVEGAKKGKLAAMPKVELATLVKAVPEGDQWLHEVKFDGYRILARLEGGKVRLISRNENDWTERFSQVAEAVAELPVESALLDGEVVVLREDGSTDFQALQNFAKRGMDARLHYQLFDLLHLNGYDLAGVPLEGRKALLEQLLKTRAANTLRYTDHIVGRGDAFYQQACQLKLEGVISKKRDAPYRVGRGRDWVKSKCLLRQEFLVVGYTDPGGSRSAFGALLLGLNEDGRIKLTGRVGTGFSDASLADIFGKLKKLERAQPGVEDAPTGTHARGLHWVEPKLVAEVAFAEWTQEGQLRHPSFMGLREDKPAEDVHAETPSEAPGTATEAAPDPGPPSHFHGVAITHPERVLWPDVPFTKYDLLRYYESVADLMLPHLTDRPLTLVRCPTGYTGECFYHKHIENFPKAVGTVQIFEPEEKRSVPYACATGLASIIGLAQMGVLEIHPWGARSDDPEKPDRLVFDLDPDQDLPWPTVAGTALLLRSELSRLGLDSWLKTTGGKGLHVVVPIKRTKSWQQVRDFSRGFVDSIVAIEPRLFTANMSKAKRGGRIFIDYLRNTRGATSVGAYSTRARPGAPVSVPLHWSEIEGEHQRPDYTVLNLHERVGASGFTDPWADIGTNRQAITAATLRKLEL